MKQFILRAYINWRYFWFGFTHIIRPATEEEWCLLNIELKDKINEYWTNELKKGR